MFVINLKDQLNVWTFHESETLFFLTIKPEKNLCLLVTLKIRKQTKCINDVGFNTVIRWASVPMKTKNPKDVLFRYLLSISQRKRKAILKFHSVTCCSKSSIFLHISFLLFFFLCLNVFGKLRY